MYKYEWDSDTGGLLLTTDKDGFSKEPRPVYYRELDLLGFNEYFIYPRNDTAPIMWAEANNYIYFGDRIAYITGGNFYEKPKLEICNSDIKELTPVNIKLMLKKNNDILDILEQDTVKKLYDVYNEYKNKVDVFHVSYSGGKDSEVALDIVKKALPYDKFIVIFGDTGMEFPDTYISVEKTRELCANEGIQFYVSKSVFNPIDSWNMFGPPASRIRWCCSVHKTAPQLILLRGLINKSNFKEMALVGVRAAESLRRSGYDYVSMGMKHKGQYSCNPILDWSSAEVYLYIYKYNLQLNDTYKKGNSRAGCLVCPGASNKNDYMNYNCYKEQAAPFVEIIKKLNRSEKENSERLYTYITNNGWKARKNGRDISLATNEYSEYIDKNYFKIIFIDDKNTWKIWMKTIGMLYENDEGYHIIFNGKHMSFNVKNIDQRKKEVIADYNIIKVEPEFFARFKNIFRKSHYCISCRVCEANCVIGCISFNNDIIEISDKCVKCGKCHELSNGCLVYNSLMLPKGVGNMKKKSIDSYANHAPKFEWFKQFAEYGDEFEIKHGLGPNQYSSFNRFLKDAGIYNEKKQRTNLGLMINLNTINDSKYWAIMLCNLAYTPEVGWLINKLEFNRTYTKKEIENLLTLEGVTKSALSSVPNAYKKIAQLPLSKYGFGEIFIEDKSKNYNLIRYSCNLENFNEIGAEVLLYSLYKFAENCGGHYQFTVDSLFDDDIERDGISPVKIFGLNHDDIIPILNGLAINYNEFISVEFTHDLESITLRSDKKSENVLDLL